MLAPAEATSGTQEVALDTLEAAVEALAADLQNPEVNLEKLEPLQLPPLSELIDSAAALPAAALPAPATSTSETLPTSLATEEVNLVELDELDATWAALVPPTTPSVPQQASPARVAWPHDDPLAPVVESEDEFGSESSEYADSESGDVPVAAFLEPIELALTPDTDHSEETLFAPPPGAGPSDAATATEPVARPAAADEAQPHVPELVAAFEQLGPPKEAPSEPLTEAPEEEAPVQPPVLPLPPAPPLAAPVPHLPPPPAPARLRRRAGPPIAVLADRGPGEMVV